MPEEGYSIEIHPRHESAVEAEAKALIDNPETAEDFGELLGVLQAIAGAGASGRKKRIHSGLVHRGDFGSCSAFYYYGEHDEPKLYFLGFCRRSDYLRRYAECAARLTQ